MIIYLYKKTHNVTGLKYLGKTSRDPYVYKGSGIYWTNHIKEHGNHVTTEILKECSSAEEVKEWGKYYSNLWNVVFSNDWANLKVEEGDGGNPGPIGSKKISEKNKGRVPWNKGKQIWNVQERERISKQLASRPPQSLETITKRVEKNKGQKRSKQQIQRMSEAQKGRKLSEDHKLKLSEARKKGLSNGTIVVWNRVK